MIKIHNVEQKTEEWFELRREHPLTASNCAAIVTAGKGLDTLCWKAVSESLSSRVVEHYSNEHIERGNELEPQAIVIYELETSNNVKAIGFVTDDAISKLAGASPDGFVGEDGMIEVKCPDDVKYLKLLAEFKENKKITIESGYYYQMQMQMLITGRKWNDYTVYNPNFKESIIIQRVEPDEAIFEKIKKGLIVGEQIINKINIKLCLKK